MNEMKVVKYSTRLEIIEEMRQKIDKRINVHLENKNACSEDCQTLMKLWNDLIRLETFN